MNSILSLKSLLLVTLAGITLSVFAQSRREIDGEWEASRTVLWEAQRAMRLFERGRLEEAKVAFSRVRLAFTRILGPRDPATLNSRNNVAAVLYAMGDYAGAEAANRAALAMCERSLGRLHPDSLASRRNLAVTLMNEGKLEDALEHARRVEAGRLRIFGENHPQYEDAVLLKSSIEEAIQDGKRDDETPRGGPSGLGTSLIGVS